MGFPPYGPDDFDKVNYVIDAWTTGCDAPWYIYVETMKPAALAALITLLTFGMDDVFRGFFRPKGLAGRRTGKRKGKWARARPKFPEVGEVLGSHIPGADEVKGKRWSALGKTLWRVDTVMQQALFWWMVIDVAEEFAFAWTSLLYEGYWCQDPTVGRFSFSTSPVSPIPNGVWKVAGFSVLDYEEGPPNWNLNTGSTGGVWATVTAALNVFPRAPFPNPTSFRVVVRDLGDQTIYADSGVNEELPGGEGAAVASGALPPGTSFEVVAWMEGTPWANYGEGVILGREILQ